MLLETTLYETIDKVRLAIERLKTFEPEDGYYLAFSGGKDSVVIYDLAVNVWREVRRTLQPDDC